VNSRLGSGSTFWIRLPIAPAELVPLDTEQRTAA